MKKILFGMLLKHKYGYIAHLSIYYICDFGLCNFKNIEVRSMKCLPLKSALHFDQDSKNKTF